MGIFVISGCAAGGVRLRGRGTLSYLWDEMTPVGQGQDFSAPLPRLSRCCDLKTYETALRAWRTFLGGRPVC